MKRDQIVIVIIFLFPFLAGAVLAYLLPNIIAKRNLFINKAEIVKFVSPQTGLSDITQEYHLWLKIEMPRPAFDNLIADIKDGTDQNTTIEKDETRSERLINENVIQNMLAIRGFGKACSERSESKGITNHDSITTTTGLPLRINKNVVLAKESIRPLDSEELRRDRDSEPLSNPQTISRERFQPQTNIYLTTAGDKTLLYIHLESGIKPKGISNLLSLTLTYLKDNKAIQSQTLPLFRY